MFSNKNLFKLIGKHLIVATGSIFIALTVVLVVSEQTSKISNKVAKERHEATLLSERAALFANVKHESEIVGTTDIKIKEALIPSNNILSFVAVLKRLATKNGVMQSFHFSSPTPSVPETSFPTSLIAYQNTISASVPTFIDYLKEFEKLPYFTKIDSLTITSGKGGWRETSTISYSASVLAQTVK